MTDLNTSRSADPAFRRWVGEFADRHGFGATEGPDAVPKVERAEERWGETTGREPRWEGKDRPQGDTDV